MKNFIKNSKTILLIVAISSAVSFANAEWNNPSTSATGGNTATPINVSTSQQDKAGKFTASVVGADSLCLTGAGCIESWPTGGDSSVTNNYTKGQWCGITRAYFQNSNYISSYSDSVDCEYDGVSYSPVNGCPSTFKRSLISDVPTSGSGSSIWTNKSFSCIKE